MVYNHQAIMQLICSINNFLQKERIIGIEGKGSHSFYKSSARLIKWKWNYFSSISSLIYYILYFWISFLFLSWCGNNRTLKWAVLAHWYHKLLWCVTYFLLKFMLGVLFYEEEGFYEGLWIIRCTSKTILNLNVYFKILHPKGI